MTNSTATPSNQALARAPVDTLSLEQTIPRWLDIQQYPFVTRTFAHPDGRLNFIDEGNGSPLLFIHGTPSWSFEWRAAIHHYSSGHRCIALDHLGFGLSEKPAQGRYLPSDHTRRLHDFVCELDLRSVTLVVHDFGGPIALPLLVRDPSRFRRVVAVNTWAWPMDDDAKGRLLMRIIRSPLGRFLYLNCNASPRWLLPASFANRSNLTASTHGQYLAPFPNRNARLAPWTLGAHLVDSAAFAPELPATISALKNFPTAIIWGKRDPLIDSSALSQWLQHLPHARSFELEGSGHFPQEETQAEFHSALDAALAP